MKWGHTTVYPNLYIIIIAPSGARKAEPMVISRDLLSNCGVKLAAERITDEALLKFVAKSIDSYKGEDGIPKFQCAATVLGEELAVLLRHHNSEFMADLTALYDCADKWKYETKGAGTDDIRGVCLNLTVSSAPDWLPMVLPIEAVGGGFTSRCFFIVEDRKGKVVSDPNINMPPEEHRIDLIHDLEKIHSVVGEARFSQTAYDFYINWYEEQERLLAENEFPMKDPRLQYYVSRRATHIKKVAMACKISRGDSLIIDEQDLTRALSYMEKAEERMPDAFKSIGRSKHAAIIEEMLEYLRLHHTCNRQELMRHSKRDLDFAEFAQVEAALESMGHIQIIRRQGGLISYKYKE